MKQRSVLLRLYLRAVGSLTAYTLGIIERYPPEHKKFLTSGFVCQSCAQTLLSKSWMADVTCYDADGEVVSIMEAKAKGRFFGCPKCNHRWPIQILYDEKKKA